MRAWLAAIAVLGCLLAGCGGDDADTGSARGNAGASPTTSPPAPTAGGSASSTPGGGGPPVRCATAPASLVSSTMGGTFGTPTESVSGSATTCTYTSADRRLVVVRFTTGRDAAAFAREKAGYNSRHEPTVDVAGLGDEAFSVTLGAGSVHSYTLVARQGTLEIRITANTGSVATEKALATHLLGRP